MNTRAAQGTLIAVAPIAAAGCDIATDPATRLAFDIESGADRLGREDGVTYRIQHSTPSKPGECTGPYELQLDQVGAMIIWCRDAGATLIIDLERRSGRAVIVDVR